MSSVSGTGYLTSTEKSGERGRESLAAVVDSGTRFVVIALSRRAYLPSGSVDSSIRYVIYTSIYTYTVVTAQIIYYRREPLSSSWRSSLCVYNIMWTRGCSRDILHVRYEYVHIIVICAYDTSRNISTRANRTRWQIDRHARRTRTADKRIFITFIARQSK